MRAKAQPETKGDTHEMNGEEYETCLHALENAHWKCQECKIENNNYNMKTRRKSKLVIAILDGNRQNIKIGNLKVLCKSCYEIAQNGASQIQLF